MVANVRLCVSLVAASSTVRHVALLAGNGGGSLAALFTQTIAIPRVVGGWRPSWAHDRTGSRALGGYGRRQLSADAVSSPTVTAAAATLLFRK